MVFSPIQLSIRRYISTNPFEKINLLSCCFITSSIQCECMLCVNVNRRLCDIFTMILIRTRDVLMSYFCYHRSPFVHERYFSKRQSQFYSWFFFFFSIFTWLNCWKFLLANFHILFWEKKNCRRIGKCNQKQSLIFPLVSTEEWNCLIQHLPTQFHCKNWNWHNIFFMFLYSLKFWWTDCHFFLSLDSLKSYRVSMSYLNR